MSGEEEKIQIKTQINFGLFGLFVCFVVGGGVFDFLNHSKFRKNKFLFNKYHKMSKRVYKTNYTYLNSSQSQHYRQ